MFRGDREKTKQEVHNLLGFVNPTDPRLTINKKAVGKFIVPVGEGEAAINMILDDLQPDPWTVKSGFRPLRSTGTAMNVAVSILETFASVGSRIISMIGGACTNGPGQIVATPKTEVLRSHHDIQKNNEKCKLMKKATEFYQTISKNALAKGIIIDLFVSSIDQSGILEM